MKIYSLILLQVPTHLPGHESDPVIFSFTNILIFIVLPVALFIFYIWWERSKARERNEKQNHEKRSGENTDDGSEGPVNGQVDDQVKDQ